MILSDRTLREQIAAGRIVIEPFDDGMIQPSSIDVRLDRFFRVFRNHTAPIIDVKQDMTGLTELVEIPPEGVFLLHPGEFVLGSTMERVAVPEDLVGRIEGKSSLGRLGLLIHSSLPASEPMLVLDEHGLVLRTIGEIVKEPRPCSVVSFDPETFEVGYHEVTGTYEGPADRIYEVRLASGRSVRVTAGHNVFTLDADGSIAKVRTSELAAGTAVAMPRRIPAPPVPSDRIRVLDLAPESEWASLTVSAPSVAPALTSPVDEVAGVVPGLLSKLGPDGRIVRSGERHGLPAEIAVTDDLAWLFGTYVANGHRGPNQVTFAADPQHLHRLEATLASLGLPVSRSAGRSTCRSALLSALLGWLGIDGGADAKRVPPVAFGWSDAVLGAFLHGLGDGGETTSEALLGDILLLSARVGRHAAATEGEHDERRVGWDRVVEVVDTGRVEPIYDLEVRPGGRKIENFLAGTGGVFVSNTAGFIDAGFEGHVTLELANVATLPITLYPGMKIGQISFMQMTTAAEHPYGRGAKGSKYQGQRGPTPSRYFENFRDS